MGFAIKIATFINNAWFVYEFLSDFVSMAAFLL